MDTITHALAGYVAVKSGLSRSTGRWGVIAGVSASFFPDLDSLLGFFLGTEFTIKYHRHLTNSLFLAPVCALIFAWLFVKVSKLPKFRAFFIIWLVGILLHTFLDVITSYGTMILSPFSAERFSLDWVFIIDPYLTLLLLLSIIAILLGKRRAETSARVSLGLLTLYISLCAYNHFGALSLVNAFAREKGLKAEVTAALPQPLSPFHWANYVMTDDKIYEGLVNLAGTRRGKPGPDAGFIEQTMARYRPVPELQYREWVKFEESPWIAKALELEGVRTFLWFARFPIARYRGIVDGAHTVLLYDLRFGNTAGRRPFQYVVKFDKEGKLLFGGYVERNSEALQFE